MNTGVLFAFLLPVTGLGQPLNTRVLVVHNNAVPDSISVANYYAAQRSIPASNRCAISSSSQTNITLAQYRSIIEAPLRACLNAVGTQKILYIVMTYGVPYVISDQRPYAVDSFVADLWNNYTDTLIAKYPTKTHSYYSDAQAEGQYYPRFVSLATHRADPTAMLIYSVWRLDGPSATLARGLVDKAKLAEAGGGPIGQACFDRRTGLNNLGDTGYNQGDWDILRAAGFLRQAGIPVLEDDKAAEIPSCPNAGFYTGWYSLRYNDVFTWNIGAIGWHLDSVSAEQPRNPAYWAPGAIAKGITATTGSTGEPYLTGMARSSGVFRNLLEGANVGDAFLRNTRWLKWHILYLGDPLYTPFRGGRPPFHVALPADSFTISHARSIVGALEEAVGTITTATSAPAGGRSFKLTHYYVGTAAVIPSSVVVPAGQTKVSFPITGYRRTYVLNDIIRATSGATELRNTISVTPLLASVETKSASAKGGTTTTGRVELYARAAAGGARVTLTSSDRNVVILPSSVLIPAGQTGVNFNFVMGAVGVDTNVTISATYDGATVKTTLRVTP